MAIKVPGPEPTSDSDQAGFLGTLLDWKARMAAGLNAPQAILAATNAIPGIMRFATAAEALLQTTDGIAMSPKQLANAHIASTLADLLTKAASLPTGSLIALPPQTYAGVGSIPSGSILRSIWIVNAGPSVSPITPLVSDSSNFVSSVNGLAKTLTNASSASTGATIALEGGVTAATVAGVNYLWNGVAFVNMNPKPLFATNAGSFTVSAGAGFVAVPLTKPTGRDSEWTASGTPGYLVPRTGWYLVNVRLRLPDGVTTGTNVGLVANLLGNETNDGIFASWLTIPAISSAATDRFALSTTRLKQATVGDVIYPTAYLDGASATIQANGVGMEILPVRDA